MTDKVLSGLATLTITVLLIPQFIAAVNMNKCVQTYSTDRFVYLNQDRATAHQFAQHYCHGG